MPSRTVIFVRISKQDAELVKKLANLRREQISDFVRDAVLVRLGLAFCSLKLGPTPVIFVRVNDLKKNIRGLTGTNKEEKFWIELFV